MTKKKSSISKKVPAKKAGSRAAGKKKVSSSKAAVKKAAVPKRKAARKAKRPTTKSVATKTAGKKATNRKSTSGKKASVRKSAIKKPAARKVTSKKPIAKKAVTKEAAKRKSVPRKTPAKKVTRKTNNESSANAAAGVAAVVQQSLNKAAGKEESNRGSGKSAEERVAAEKAAVKGLISKSVPQKKHVPTGMAPSLRVDAAGAAGTQKDTGAGAKSLFSNKPTKVNESEPAEKQQKPSAENAAQDNEEAPVKPEITKVADADVEDTSSEGTLIWTLRTVVAMLAVAMLVWLIHLITPANWLSPATVYGMGMMFLGVFVGALIGWSLKKLGE